MSEIKITMHKARLVKGAVFLTERPAEPAKRRFGFIVTNAVPQRPEGWYMMSELVFRGLPHRIPMDRHFSRFGKLYTRPMVVVTLTNGMRLTNFFDSNEDASAFADAQMRSHGH